MQVRALTAAKIIRADKIQARRYKTHGFEGIFRLHGKPYRSAREHIEEEIMHMNELTDMAAIEDDGIDRWVDEGGFDAYDADYDLAAMAAIDYDPIIEAEHQADLDDGWLFARDLKPLIDARLDADTPAVRPKDRTAGINIARLMSERSAVSM